MQIEKISYSKTYQIGIANFEKIQLEGSLAPTEDPEKELLTLKNLVEKFHKETNPEPQKKVKKNIEITEAINKVLDDIENCATKEELETYFLISKGNLVTSNAYQEKLQSFA